MIIFFLPSQWLVLSCPFIHASLQYSCPTRCRSCSQQRGNPRLSYHLELWDALVHLKPPRGLRMNGCSGEGILVFKAVGKLPSASSVFANLETSMRKKKTDNCSHEHDPISGPTLMEILPVYSLICCVDVGVTKLTVTTLFLCFYQYTEPLCSSC